MKLKENLKTWIHCQYSVENSVRNFIMFFSRETKSVDDITYHEETQSTQQVLFSFLPRGSMVTSQDISASVCAKKGTCTCDLDE